MKSASEIEERLRAIVIEELRRRLARDVLPHLCVHNRRQPLDHRPTVYGEPNESYNRISAGIEDGVSLPVLQTIGLCMLGAESPDTWAGTICEEPIDAQRCPYFAYKQARSDVHREFLENLRDPVWVETHLPAAHALLWVMNTPLKVEPSPSPWRRRWLRVREILAMLVPWPARENSPEASVYLPPLDAFPEEDSARATASH
jgi:hypothetical protein